MDIESLADQYVLGNASEVVHGFIWLLCDGSLKRLKRHHSLERWRVQGYLIEVYELMKIFNNGEVNRGTEVRGQDETRNNAFRLDKFRYNKEKKSAS